MIKIIESVDQFTAEKAWGALDIAAIEGATVRVHWTDEPYFWHQNDGAEVFLVLTGKVTMRYRIDGIEHSVVLNPFDVFCADVGDEHIAEPEGPARILVVEKRGSI